MKKIRVIIVGVGNIAADHVKGIQAAPDAELVAVCGTNLERATAFGKTYGVPGFADLKQLMSEVQFDAACICTPQMFRTEPCMALLNAGKHLLVEKPFVSSVTAGRDLLAAAKKAGVIIGGVSQRRFFQPVQRMHRAIKSGAFSPIVGNIQVYGHRDREYYEQLSWRGKRGDGLMFNQTAHQLDILLWLMGDVANVSGLVANHTHTYNEAEDFASASISFKSGKTANYLATLSVESEEDQYARIHLVGANEQIIGVQTDRHMWVAGKSTKPPSLPFNDVWSLAGGDLSAWQAEDLSPGTPAPHYHTLQIADFVEAIQQGREPLVPGSDLQKVVELIAGVYLSSLLGERIELPLSDEHAKKFDQWLETGAVR